MPPPPNAAPGSGKGVTLGYRDHCAVDDKFGIVTATIATAADYDDATMLEPLLDEHRRHVGADAKRATGDCAYGTKANVAMLRERRIMPYVKPRGSKSATGGWLDRMPDECPRGASVHWLGRRLAVGEGRFAHAKVRHGHGRCRWRRRWRVQIQCYLVAMTQNLLKLTRHGPRRPSPPADAATATVLTTRSLISIAGSVAAEFLRRFQTHPPSSIQTAAASL
jgi:IS5 family transposase